MTQSQEMGVEAIRPMDRIDRADTAACTRPFTATYRIRQVALHPISSTGIRRSPCLPESHGRRGRPSVKGAPSRPPRRPRPFLLEPMPEAPIALFPTNPESPARQAGLKKEN